MHTDPNGMIDPPGAPDLWTRALEETLSQSLVPELSLTKAMQIVDKIEKLRAVQDELKRAFKDDALAGGWKAALEHPLWGWSEQRIAVLHEEMKGLI